MSAIAVDRFGGPEVLTMHTLPVPLPGASEVLIAVHTAEVGGWDADMRGGWSMSGKKPRFLWCWRRRVGHGCGCRIASEAIQIGDPVYSYAWDNPKGGFYAEYVASPAETARRCRRHSIWRRPVAIPIAALTAIQGIDDALHLKKGERLIILGASGGLGCSRSSLRSCAARGCCNRVRCGRRRLARKLGADAAIDGRTATSPVRRGRSPRRGRCDCCVHSGKALTKCLDTLRRGGRLAYPNGIEPVPKKRRGIRRIRTTASPVERNGASRARDNGGATPGSDRGEFVLAEAARAHERLAQGHILGKSFCGSPSN